MLQNLELLETPTIFDNATELLQVFIPHYLPLLIVFIRPLDYYPNAWSPDPISKVSWTTMMIWAYKDGQVHPDFIMIERRMDIALGQDSKGLG